MNLFRKSREQWNNWSGSLSFTPSDYYTPETEEELVDVVKRCRANGQRIRVAGGGHSSSALTQTDDVLINLQHFKGLVSTDDRAMTATLRAGMTVEECNKALEEKGYALFNTGDVDVQYLIGAISTGTHGTGKRLQNLSSMLQGVRCVNADGEITEYNIRSNPDELMAFRVSLGALGIITQMTVKVIPLITLRRIELFTTFEQCMTHFDELADENRNVDFYWYPRRDEVKIRILNEPGTGTQKFSFPHCIVRDEEGLIGEQLPRKRELKFDETEFSFDAVAAKECFRAVRKRIMEKHRRDVAWRTLFRTIAADKAYLSPHYGRDSATISLHHNAGLPYKEYFEDIASIFNDYAGRPHWGKKHFMKTSDLKAHYSQWKRYHEVRRKLDPDEVFLNEYLRTILYDHA